MGLHTPLIPARAKQTNVKLTQLKYTNREGNESETRNKVEKPLAREDGGRRMEDGRRQLKSVYRAGIHTPAKAQYLLV